MQLSEFDAALTAKDEAKLWEQSQSHSHSPSQAATPSESSGEDNMVPPVRPVRQWRGKAPLVDTCMRENPEAPISMHTACISNSANLSNGYASLLSSLCACAINKHFGRLATFWFGTFTMLFAPLGVLFVMKTLEDEQYVDINLPF